MHKLIYTAIIPLLINSTIAGDLGLRSGDELPAIRLVNINSYESNNSISQSDDVTTPQTTHSSTEIDSPNLTQLVEWKKKRWHIEENVSDEETCNQNDPFIFCAEALKPFMKNQRSSYTIKEEENSYETLHKHKEDSKLKKKKNNPHKKLHDIFTCDPLKKLTPTERYEITQKLHIMAMFEGVITFTKITKKGNKTKKEKVQETLANRFKIKKDRVNTMRMLCTQIEKSIKTSEEATLTLFDEWKKEEVLEKRVKSCSRQLKNNGFFQYHWIETDLVDLLKKSISYPEVVKAVRYDQKWVQKLCKRIFKKGHKKRNIYIKNVASIIASRWREKNVYNKAIAGCTKGLKKIKAYAYKPVCTKEDTFYKNTESFESLGHLSTISIDSKDSKKSHVSV